MTWLEVIKITIINSIIKPIKENDMLDVVLVLVAIYLGIKVIGIIAGLLIGGKIVYDLTKDKDK